MWGRDEIWPDWPPKPRGTWCKDEECQCCSCIKNQPFWTKHQEMKKKSLKRTKNRKKRSSNNLFSGVNSVLISGNRYRFLLHGLQKLVPAACFFPITQKWNMNMKVLYITLGVQRPLKEWVFTKNHSFRMGLQSTILGDYSFMVFDFQGNIEKGSV